MQVCIFPLREQKLHNLKAIKPFYSIRITVLNADTVQLLADLKLNRVIRSEVVIWAIIYLPSPCC